MENIVAITKKENITYPINPPFNPPESYPEYPFAPLDVDKENQVYSLVRELFALTGMDLANYGKSNWNPFGNIVKSGDKVVIKPNFVIHFNASGQDVNAVITHGSIIRAVMDYVYIALQGKGEIIIADAPQMNADFVKICEITGIQNVVDYYQQKLRNTDIKVSLFDLRQERTIYKYGIVWKRIKLDGDVLGYCCVDLCDASETIGIDYAMVYGADYNRCETIQAHSNGSHKYIISRTILDADVIISIPKMKVHRKAGVTLNFKNMVGINGNKNYILHYRVGPPIKGGDEFSHIDSMKITDRKIRDFLLGKFWQWGKYPYVLWSQVMRSYFRIFGSSDITEKGDWYGNDTIWRTVLDLNKILFYTDKNGVLQKTKQRRYFSIIDGIVAGEGEGPLAPDPKICGILIGGTSPFFVDFIASELMGFDMDKIPILRNVLKIKNFPLVNGTIEDIIVRSNIKEWDRIPRANIRCFAFKPSEGWKGHIEL